MMMAKLGLARSKLASCLIDSSSPYPAKVLGKLSKAVVALLLIGTFVSAGSVESGQFTTTVKKELPPTTTTTTTTTTTAEPSLAAGLGLDLGPAEERAPELEAVGAKESGLLPDEASLFSKEAVDVVALDKMDCHLRNMDYCYAGLMGASGRALPETDAELEVRCDELRAMTSCLALYNRRCQSMKVFSMLAPMATMERVGALMPASLGQAALNETGLLVAPSGRPQTEARLADLSAICSPQAKGASANRQLRQQLFQLARCVNRRVPLLAPCIEDLKAAIQLFYEPRRALPLKPTCCALSRFRSCSTGTLDNFCGLSSFAQLEEAFSSGPAQMLKVVDRICHQGASRFDSAYCLEVLPPSGMKAPQRRGHKASKLARALDLVSFAPVAQL